MLKKPVSLGAAKAPRSTRSSKSAPPTPAQPRNVRSSADGTRQNILDAAIQLFADKSFDGASTRDIAQHAGVAQPLLSYHFSNKGTLWKAAVDLLFDGLRQAVDEAAADLRKAVDVALAKVLVREFIVYCASHPQLLQIITGECKTEGERMDWLVDKHIRPLYEFTVDMASRLAKAGLLTIPPTNFYYILIGSGATMFVLGPECRRLTGLDTRSQAVIDAHVHAVITLLFGPRDLHRDGLTWTSPEEQDSAA